MGTWHFKRGSNELRGFKLHFKVCPLLQNIKAKGFCQIIEPVKSLYFKHFLGTDCIAGYGSIRPPLLYMSLASAFSRPGLQRILPDRKNCQPLSNYIFFTLLNFPYIRFPSVPVTYALTL